jgi:hypothetical protein
MIWAIICFIVFVVLSVKFLCDPYYDWGEKFSLTFLSALAAFLVAILLTIFGGAITTSVAETTYVKTNDTKIIALHGGVSTDGCFYITSGRVGDDLYYYYAVETQFGYKTERVKAGVAYIKYTDEEPHIEEYAQEFVNEASYMFGIPMGSNQYIIYCPEGTIITDFEIDLE